MIAVTKIFDLRTRRILDQDHAISDLIALVVSPADLSPRREHEIREAAAARHHRAAELTEAAAVAAAALERAERSADQHVQVCQRCHHWRVWAGACPGFRQIRRDIDKRHHEYRRAMRRLEVGS